MTRVDIESSMTKRISLHPNKSINKQHNQTIKHLPNIVAQLKGFTTIPLLLPHTDKIQYSDIHNYGYFYYKPHSDRNKLTVPNTLFIINIPIYFIESQIQHVFTRFGSVVDVQFVFDSIQPNMNITHESRTYGTKHALVVYGSNDSIDTAMCYTHDPSHDTDSYSLSWSSDPSVHLGISHYITQYHSQRPNIDTLQLQIDTLMNTFDIHKQQSKHNVDEPVVDSDGFQLVTYNNKNQYNTNKLLKVDELRSDDTVTGEAKRKQKRKQKQVIFLYQHQLHENKSNKLQLLQQQFQHDKLKINQLKSKNKLNPFK